MTQEAPGQRRQRPSLCRSAWRAVWSPSVRLGCMSRRNREKRAAKQKNRRRGLAEGERKGFNPGSGPDQEFMQMMLVLALHQAAMCPDGDSQAHAAELIEEFSASARDLDLAADAAMVDAIGVAWEGGWSPSDLCEFARRKLEPSAAGYLTEAIVREAKRYAVSTLHPRWRAEIAARSARHLGCSVETAYRLDSRTIASVRYRAAEGSSLRRANS